MLHTKEEIQRLAAEQNAFVELSKQNTASLLKDCLDGSVSASCRRKSAAALFEETRSILSYDAVLAQHFQGVLDGSVTPQQAFAEALTYIGRVKGGVNTFLDTMGVAGGVVACASGVGTAPAWPARSAPWRLQTT